MGLATVPLVKLYDTAAAVLREGGGTVMLGTSARSISFDGRRMTGVVTANGLVDAAAVVSAVPFDRLDKLVSATAREADTRLRDLDRLEVSPILGVHLWFDRPVMTLPHLVLVDAGVHWLFNKGTDSDGRQHVHAVVSAADDWMALPEQQITEKVVADIHRALPASKGIEPIQARCIKEKRATFAATPGADAIRPTAGPAPARGAAIDNLYLAGDWCDTGWPATMEGAVRSGYAAAEAICHNDGLEALGVVDDVPASWLARLLRGK
jgi:zeta-carotene desaturase